MVQSDRQAMTHPANPPINRYLERHPVSNVVRLEPWRDEIEAEVDAALREYEEIMEGRK